MSTPCPPLVASQYDVGQTDPRRIEASRSPIRLSCMMGGAVFTELLSLSQTLALSEALMHVAYASRRRAQGVKPVKHNCSVWISTDQCELGAELTKIEDHHLPPVCFTLRVRRIATFTDYLTSDGAQSVAMLLYDEADRIRRAATYARLYPNDTATELQVRMEADARASAARRALAAQVA